MLICCHILSRVRRDANCRTTLSGKYHNNARHYLNREQGRHILSSLKILKHFQQSMLFTSFRLCLAKTTIKYTIWANPLHVYTALQSQNALSLVKGADTAFWLCTADKLVESVNKKFAILMACWIDICIIMKIEQTSFFNNEHISHLF